MNNPSLNRVTLQTLENYRTAATQAVTAYRLGGHRLVRAVNGVLTDSVYPRTAKLAPRATRTMDGVRDEVSTVVVKGIDQIAHRTEQVIELGSTTAVAQLGKVTRFAAGVENQLVASGLETAARLTMPGAKVALAVSGKVAEGAAALADAAGARHVRKAVRKAGAAAKRSAKPVSRQAQAVMKTATRRVAKATKAMDKPVAKAQRATRAAGKAVSRSITKTVNKTVTA